MFLPLIELLNVVVCSSENANVTENKYPQGLEDARNNKKQVEQQASLESSKTGHSTSTRGHEEAKGKKGIVGRTLDWLMGLNEKKTSYYNDPNGIGNIDKNGKPNERTKHAKTSAPSLSKGSYERPSIVYYLDSPEFADKTSFQVIKLIEKYFEDNNFCDLYLSWCESLSEVITESRDGIAKDIIASTMPWHKIGTDPLRNCFKHITSTFAAKKSMPKDLNEQSELAEQTLAFFDLMIKELSDRFDNEIEYRNSLPKQKDDKSTITFDGNADDEAKDKAKTKEDDYIVKQNSEVIPNSEPLSDYEILKLAMLLQFLEASCKSIAELAKTKENNCFDFLDYVTDLCADLYDFSKGFHDGITHVHSCNTDNNKIFPRYHGIIEEFGNFVTKASFVKIANEKHKDLYFIFNTFGSCIKKTATQHMQIHLPPYQKRVKNFVITLREQVSFTVEIIKDLQVSTNFAETERNSDDTSVKTFAEHPDTNSQKENEKSKKIPITSDQDKRSVLNHTTSPSPIADASNDALSSAKPAETSEIETSDRTSFAKPEPPAPQTGRDERQNVLKVDGDVLVQAGAAECPYISLSAEEEKKPKVVAQNALQNEVRKGFSPWQIGAACTIGLTVALALAYLGMTKYYQ